MTGKPRHLSRFSYAHDMLSPKFSLSKFKINVTRYFRTESLTSMLYFDLFLMYVGKRRDFLQDYFRGGKKKKKKNVTSSRLYFVLWSMPVFALGNYEVSR